MVPGSVIQRPIDLAGESLDSLLTSGIYESSEGDLSLSYPEESPGILSVVLLDNGDAIQTFVSSSSSATYIRTYNSGVFTSWSLTGGLSFYKKMAEGFQAQPNNSYSVSCADGVDKTVTILGNDFLDNHWVDIMVVDAVSDTPCKIILDLQEGEWGYDLGSYEGYHIPSESNGSFRLQLIGDKFYVTEGVGEISAGTALEEVVSKVSEMELKLEVMQSSLDSLKASLDNTAVTMQPSGQV